MTKAISIEDIPQEIERLQKVNDAYSKKRISYLRARANKAIPTTVSNKKMDGTMMEEIKEKAKEFRVIHNRKNIDSIAMRPSRVSTYVKGAYTVIRIPLYADVNSKIMDPFKELMDESNNIIKLMRENFSDSVKCIFTLSLDMMREDIHGETEYANIFFSTEIKMILRRDHLERIVEELILELSQKMEDFKESTGSGWEFNKSYYIDIKGINYVPC